MLNMDMEFKKGIFIVRLKGILNKNTYKTIKDELSNMIQNNGIKYLMINLKDLKYIDSSGVSIILDNYKYIEENKGKMVVCGINRLFDYNSNITDNLYQVQEEVAAFNLINL